MAAQRCDAGTLELGNGLEVLVSACLQAVPVGDVLDVFVSAKSAALELPAWTRLAGHEAVGERAQANNGRPGFIVSIRRGGAKRIIAEDLPEGRHLPPLRNGSDFHSADLRLAAEALTEHANPTDGLVPLGAVAEAGAPSFDWELSNRSQIWANDVADLTERASELQWDATVDIPWQAAQGLPDEVELAVAQVMTYIAQNEYAALYIPAGFLGQVNPRYTEMLLWLASHVHDEARHVEVFTKRALAGGARGYALASTQLSLQTLIQEADFTSAALLLNVLGEGTFLDLLSFVERHAPDEATAACARLAHRDEQRHVHFGISHIRQTAGADPEKKEALVAAAESRAAKLTELNGLSSVVTDSLTLMAAASREHEDLRDAAKAVATLMVRMEENRIKRLRSAGFDEKTARYLSELHTPNLM